MKRLQRSSLFAIQQNRRPEIPTIAAIEGYAWAGPELALTCDVRIASSNAKMGFRKPDLASCQERVQFGPQAGGRRRRWS